MNGAAQTLISATAANIGDIGVDIGIGRTGKLFEERDRGHDLPRLAVAALRNVFRNPGALHRMAIVRGEAFDGGNLRAIKGADWHRAGAHRLAVDMHRTGAALCDAATEIRAGQTDDIAHDPN